MSLQLTSPPAQEPVSLAEAKTPRGMGYTTSSEDDPYYRQFEVPDDLIW